MYVFIINIQDLFIPYIYILRNNIFGCITNSLMNTQISKQLR